MAGQPKPAFYAILVLVVAALLGFAVYRSDLFAPQPQPKPTEKVDPKQLAQPEDPGGQPIQLMAKTYEFKAPDRLPEVKGPSQYAPMKDNTVKFALNVWAGWAPIILANEGRKPGKIWRTPDGQGFKVSLELIDDASAMIGAYQAGEIHIGWGTLDMVPLFVDGMWKKTGQPKDSRVMPRIYQQIDWSNGGDGIVVRENIKTVADLRGKKLVLAQNSPSQYFALNMIVAAGMQPADVPMLYTDTAFKAAAAFNADRSLAGAVSWSPDIYNLAGAKGNRMLVTTKEANRLIADIWFARADFAKDHPGIIEGLVRGIFDAMQDLKNPEKKKLCADLMDKAYDLPPGEAMKMFEDAHNTNWAENYQFFCNQNNPTNFERIWRQAYYLYRQIGTIQNPPVPFDQVMDFSIIQKLANEDKYKSQKDEYQVQFAPTTVGKIRAEGEEILTNTVTIHFAPNESDLAYDPNSASVLQGIAELVGKFGAAQVIVEGHTDSSKRGQVPVDVVKTLSLDRANAVKEALIEKHKIDPTRLHVDGLGWDRPADPKNPLDQAKNRRVEIKVYTPEKQ